MKMWRPFITVLVALSFGSAIGCKEKAAAPVDPIAAAQQSGAATANPSESQEVLDALEKKDFDAVMAGLLKMKQSASTPEQQTQFAGFLDDVKMKLLDEAPNNAKAAEVLAIVRQMTGGR